MELKNIIKSFVIVGLLSSVTDVNAANLKDGPREDCHIFIVQNDSHPSKDKDPNTQKPEDAYYVEANFTPCNDVQGRAVKAIVRPGTPKTFCVEPNTEVWLERRTDTNPSNTGTTHLPGTKMTINAGWHYYCTGSNSDDLAACHRETATKACPAKNDNDNLN